MYGTNFISVFFLVSVRKKDRPVCHLPNWSWKQTSEINVNLEVNSFVLVGAPRRHRGQHVSQCT